MSYQFNISDIGLRLIKAYEGYSPDGQILRGGKKLVGYGRVTNDLNAKLSEKDAAAQLMADLGDIENIVNTNVHAAMSQGQFDALCSLAYSIGADAFLGSDVLHAMNRGEVIGAANGFDGWRLGKIDGQIYVVDALVRRRTSEKALFLRSHSTVPAPRQVLPALKDETATSENIAHISGEPQETTNIVPLYQNRDVAQVEDEDVFDLTNKVDEGLPPSPIAEAAAEVSDRLDALMDKEPTPTEDWPDSLIDNQQDVTEWAPETTIEPAESDPLAEFELEPEQIVELDETNRYASADKYIEPGVVNHKRQNLWTYITMMVLGLTMAGGGLWARMTENPYFGDLSRLAWSAIFAIGFLMLVMGVYYLVKQLLEKAQG